MASISFACFSADCFSRSQAILLPVLDSLYLAATDFNLVNVAAASDLDLCLAGGGVPRGAPSRYVTSFSKETLDVFILLSARIVPLQSFCTIDVVLLPLPTLLQLDEPLEAPPSASTEMLCLSNDFLGAKNCISLEDEHSTLHPLDFIDGEVALRMNNLDLSADELEHDVAGGVKIFDEFD